MNSDDFESYLALLASLLRLDKSQQREIGSELRTHLEDRLEDLLASGVPRDEAIRRALAEFGDAAGLAAEFVSLSRNRKRRWLMRLASFSVAAMLLVAFGLITFWPGSNSGPGPAIVTAQAPPGATPPKPAAEAPHESPLAEKLNQRIDAEFVETPLTDVIDFLSQTAGIQMYVNRKRMEDEGVAIDSPITESLKRVRLATLLDLTLGELGLVYVEKDDFLVITTAADADATTEVRVYDCRDLLTMPGLPGEKKLEAPLPGTLPIVEGGMTGPAAPLSEHDRRAERLMNILKTAVDPNHWVDAGGVGTISEYNGLIVVSHSARTHAKVEKVLDMLRQAAGLEKPKAGVVK
ncbi:MAG: permease prefix domain 1-containing protein [Pirellulaceae bacterium]|nr:permease prefix domain 1-containing protein [Pirellulaceae bacterium]